MRCRTFGTCGFHPGALAGREHYDVEVVSAVTLLGFRLHDAASVIDPT